MYQDTPLMLAADRDILAELPLQKNQQHPTGLKLWLKCIKAIVNRRKNNATAEVHRTHERLQQFFRFWWLKKPTATLENSALSNAPDT